MNHENDLNLMVVSKRYNLINTYGHSLMGVGNCYVTDKAGEIGEIIEKHKVKLALVDVGKGNSQGMDALEELGKNHPEVATIAVADRYDSNLAMMAIKAGAGEVILEPIDVQDVKSFLKKTNTFSKQKAEAFNLLPGIVHDFNNAVHRMVIYSKMIKNTDNHASTQEVFNFMINNLIKAGKSASSILYDMLNWTKNFSQLDKFEKTGVQLKPLIDEVHAEFESIIMNKSLSFQSDVDNDIFVYADSYMLKFVIRNLLENACKFTAQEDKIDVAAILRDDHVFIVVSDTGKGIDDDTCNAINEGKKLENTGAEKSEGKGSGMGLCICKEYLKKHGSDLCVVSELGKGSCIYFHLERYDD